MILTTSNELGIDIMPFLQDERLQLIGKKLSEYKDKYGRDLADLDDDEGYATRLVEKYAFCTSVLTGIYKNNLENKKILEVGPGYAGRFMLDHLIENGADAYGIDLHNHPDYTGPSRGRYLITTWEKMLRNIPAESIDLIHVKSMHPEPYPMEVKEDYYNGNFMQRMKAKKYIRKYSSLLGENIDSLLKKEGFFICWSKHDDFRLDPKELRERNYKHNSYNLFGTMSNFILDIYQK